MLSGFAGVLAGFAVGGMLRSQRDGSRERQPPLAAFLEGRAAGAQRIRERAGYFVPLAVDPVVPLVALGHGPRSAPGTAADFGVGQSPNLTGKSDEPDDARNIRHR